jgi:hypothetical protein
MNKLLFLLVLFSFSANAENYLYLGSWSKHFKSHSTGFEYNDTHNLIALQKDGYTLGTFENSFYRQTYFLTKAFYKAKYKDVVFIMNAGLSYGYGACLSDSIREAEKLCGIAFPEFVYTKYKIQPVATVTHKLYSFSLRFQF